MIVKTKSSYTKIKIWILTKSIQNKIKIYTLYDMKIKYLYTFHINDRTKNQLVQVKTKIMNIIMTLI
jgi:hypothetical protein